MKHCAFCNHEFSPKVPHQIFCDWICSGAQKHFEKMLAAEDAE